jgi:hypothetical protein
MVSHVCFATKCAAVQGNNFGLSGRWSFDWFAQPHGEEETAHGQLGCDEVDDVAVLVEGVHMAE